MGRFYSLIASTRSTGPQLEPYMKAQVQHPSVDTSHLHGPSLGWFNGTCVKVHHPASLAPPPPPPEECQSCWAEPDVNLLPPFESWSLIWFLSHILGEIINLAQGRSAVSYVTFKTFGLIGFCLVLACGQKFWLNLVVKRLIDEFIGNLNFDHYLKGFYAFLLNMNQEIAHCVLRRINDSCILTISPWLFCRANYTLIIKIKLLASI